MPKKKQQDQAVMQRREYKFDRAMQEAAKRAASHPRMKAMASNVPDLRKAK